MGRVLLAVIVLGKMFGGTLYGLGLLELCISSGVYLWMKELVWEGRGHEWQSKKELGQMVKFHPISNYHRD